MGFLALTSRSLTSRPNPRANLGLVQGGQIRLGRSEEWRRREEWSGGVEDCVYIPKFLNKLFDLLRGAPISRGFYQLDAFFGALCTIFPAESI